MPTPSDEPTTPRMATGFLNTLRDVLFEATPNAPPKASLPPPSSATESSDLEAARQALRRGIEESLGSGAREFALQVEALREALPDARQRQRAALRVLALKGISGPDLIAELERAIAGLARQSEAFNGKLSARRAALAARRSEAVEACRAETAETEQTVARLEAELAAARTRLADSVTQRDRALAACDESATLLATKQQTFERAFRELCGEYATLRQQLSNTEERA